MHGVPGGWKWGVYVDMGCSGEYIPELRVGIIEPSEEGNGAKDGEGGERDDAAEHSIGNHLRHHARSWVQRLKLLCRQLLLVDTPGDCAGVRVSGAHLIEVGAAAILGGLAQEALVTVVRVTRERRRLR